MCIPVKAIAQMLLAAAISGRRLTLIPQDAEVCVSELMNLFSHAATYEQKSLFG